MWFRYGMPILVAAALSGQDVNRYSLEKEAALGAALSQETRKHTQPIDNEAVRDYIDGLGHHLASQLPDTGIHWTFMPVFDSLTGRTREPAALPGGFIFVSARLILDARDESEFAGMLAHAMAHVSERHGTRMATRGQVENLSTIPLIFMGGWPGAGDHDASSVLLPIGFLKYQRANELDADRVAVGIMAAAGYDPAALMRYLDRMQPASADAPPQRSAMPPRAERIAALEQAIEALPPAGALSKGEEFQKIQEEVRRLMPAATDEPPRLRRPPSLYHQ